MAKPHPKPWPKLSEALPGREPDFCQRCAAGIDLTRWREHDEEDRPLPAVIVLCRSCADRIIEPHPRLYAELNPNEPWPGTMVLCVDCRHRDGLRCTQASHSGGPGVHVILPKPYRVHVCRSPRRLSGWVTVWPGPPRDCSGRVIGDGVSIPGESQGTLFDAAGGPGPYGGR